MTSLSKVKEYISYVLGNASGISADVCEGKATVSVVYTGKGCRSDAGKLLSLFSSGYPTEGIPQPETTTSPVKNSYGVALRLSPTDMQHFRSLAGGNLSRFCRVLLSKSDNIPFNIIVEESGSTKLPPLSDTQTFTVVLPLAIYNQIERQSKSYNVSRSNVFSKRILWGLQRYKAEPPKEEEPVYQLLNWNDNANDPNTNQ